jgi:hypothetical protein
MWGEAPGSRIVTAAVVLLGVAGILIGTGGIYYTLTASDAQPERGAETLGAFGCEPVDREARSVPNADFVERLVTSGEEIESVGTSDSEAGARLTLTVGGELLNASASRFAGGPQEPPNVSRREDTVIVTDPERAPFRLWIDAVSGGGTVVRTELDVCPPDGSR